MELENISSVTNQQDPKQKPSSVLTNPPSNNVGSYPDEASFRKALDVSIQETILNKQNKSTQYTPPTLLVNKILETYNVNLGLNGFNFTAQDYANMLLDPAGNIESTKKVMSDLTNKDLSDVDAIKAYLSMYPNEKTAADLQEVLKDKVYKNLYRDVKEIIKKSPGNPIKTTEAISNKLPHYYEKNSIAKKAINDTAIKEYSKQTLKQLEEYQKQVKIEDIKKQKADIDKLLKQPISDISIHYSKDKSNKSEFFDIADTLKNRTIKIATNDDIKKRIDDYYTALEEDHRNVEYYVKHPDEFEKLIKEGAIKFKDDKSFSDYVFSKINKSEKIKQELDRQIRSLSDGYINGLDDFIFHSQVYLKSQDAKKNSITQVDKTLKDSITQTDKTLKAVTTYKTSIPEDLGKAEREWIESVYPNLISSVALGYRSKFGHIQKNPSLQYNKAYNESVLKYAIAKFAKTDIGYTITSDIMVKVKERALENLSDLESHFKPEQRLSLSKNLQGDLVDFTFNYLFTDKVKNTINEIYEKTQSAGWVYKTASVLQLLGISFTKTAVESLTFGYVSPFEKSIITERPYTRSEMEQRSPFEEGFDNDYFAFSLDLANATGTVLGFAASFIVPNLILSKIGYFFSARNIVNLLSKMNNEFFISKYSKAIGDRIIYGAARMAQLKRPEDFNRAIRSLGVSGLSEKEQLSYLTQYIIATNAAKVSSPINNLILRTNAIESLLSGTTIIKNTPSFVNKLSKTYIFKDVLKPYGKSVINPANIYSALSEAVMQARENQKQQKIEHYKELLAYRYSGFLDDFRYKEQAYKILGSDGDIMFQKENLDKLLDAAYDADLIYNGFLLLFTNPLGINNLATRVLESRPLRNVFGSINVSNPLKGVTRQITKGVMEINPVFISRNKVLTTQILDFISSSAIEAAVESFQEIAQDKVGSYIYKNVLIPSLYSHKVDDSSFKILSSALSDKRLYDLTEEDKYTAILTTISTLLVGGLGGTFNYYYNKNQLPLVIYDKNVERIKQLFEGINSKGGFALMTTQGLFINPDNNIVLNSIETLIRNSNKTKREFSVLNHSDKEQRRIYDASKVQIYGALDNMGLLETFSKDMMVELSVLEQEIEELKTLDDVIDYNISMSGMSFSNEVERARLKEEIKQKIKDTWFGEISEKRLRDKTGTAQESDILLEEEIAKSLKDEMLKSIKREQNLLNKIKEGLDNKEINQKIDNLIKGYYDLDIDENIEKDTERHTAYFETQLAFEEEVKERLKGKETEKEIEEAINDLFSEENKQSVIDSVLKRLKERGVTKLSENDLKDFIDWHYDVKKGSFTKNAVDFRESILQKMKQSPNNLNFKYLDYRLKKQYYENAKAHLRNIYFYSSFDIEETTKEIKENKAKIHSILNEIDSDLADAFANSNGDINVLISVLSKKQKESYDKLQMLLDYSKENSLTNQIDKSTILNIYNRLVEEAKDLYKQGATLFVNFDKLKMFLEENGLDKNDIDLIINVLLFDLGLEPKDKELIEELKKSNLVTEKKRTLVINKIILFLIKDLASKDVMSLTNNDLVFFNILKDLSSGDSALKSTVDAISSSFNYSILLSNIIHARELNLVSNINSNGVMSVYDLINGVQQKSNVHIISAIKYINALDLAYNYLKYIFRNNPEKLIFKTNEYIDEIIQTLLELLEAIYRSDKYSISQERYIASKLRRIVDILKENKINLIHDVESFHDVISLVVKALEELSSNTSEIRYGDKNISVIDLITGIIQYESSIIQNFASPSVNSLSSKIYDYISDYTALDERSLLLSLLLSNSKWDELKTKTKPVIDEIINNFNFEKEKKDNETLKQKKETDKKEKEKTDIEKDKEQIQNKKTNSKTKAKKDVGKKEDKKEKSAVNVSVNESPTEQVEKKEGLNQISTESQKGPVNISFEDFEYEAVNSESLLILFIEKLDSIVEKTKDGKIKAIKLDKPENLKFISFVLSLLNDSDSYSKLLDKAENKEAFLKLIDVIKEHVVVKSYKDIESFYNDALSFIELSKPYVENINSLDDVNLSILESLLKDLKSKREKIDKKVKISKDISEVIKNIETLSKKIDNVKKEKKKKEIKEKTKTKPVTKKQKEKEEKLEETKPEQAKEQEKTKESEPITTKQDTSESQINILEQDKVDKTAPVKEEKPEPKKQEVFDTLDTIDIGDGNKKTYNAALNIDTTLLDFIFEEFRSSGKKPIIVGGSVRDALLGVKPKDIDVEVYNSTIQEVIDTLKQYGYADEVGVSFGVVKFIPYDYYATLIEDDTLPEKGLLLPIGISGSGKSTWIDKIKNRKNVVVVSPDEIRKELTGDISDQSKNKQVWEETRKRAISYLKEGKLVIIDATNVNTKLRLKFISDIKKQVNNFDLYYKIFDSDPELSKKRIKQDLSKKKERAAVPDKVIDKQYNDYLDSLKYIKAAKSLEEAFDFAVPRLENKVGKGYKGFKVEMRKDITMEEAFSRRDFTFNSIGYDPVEKVIHDYYGGVRDMKNKIIRHTSEKFREDPLRILRAMQFQARYGYAIAEETYQVMKDIIESGEFDHLTSNKAYEEFLKKKKEAKARIDAGKGTEEDELIITYITKERIVEEFEKWAVKGKHHGLIFDFLRKSGLGEKMFPELLKLKDTPQDPVHHPEGDVEIHTSLVLEQASKIAARENMNGEEKLILVLSALLHDIAKPITTKETIDKKTGRVKITSPGHEEAGEPIAVDILQRMGFKGSIVTLIGRLVKHHLQHVHLNNLPEGKKFVRLEEIMSDIAESKDKPAKMYLLFRLIEADNMGRSTASKYPETLTSMEKVYQDYVSKYGYIYKNIIKGDDLLKAIEKKGYQLVDKRFMKNILEDVKKEHLQGKINEKNVIEKAINLAASKHYIKRVVPRETLKAEGDVSKYRKLTPEQEENAFAVFAVVRFPDGTIAATTRDKGDIKIGLPGGKVDKGETIVQAVIREAKEEGWKLGKFKGVVASDIVEGKNVVWLEFENAEPLEDYKEKYRGITPIKVQIEEVASGYGNEFLLDLYKVKPNTKEQQIIDNKIKEAETKQEADTKPKTNITISTNISAEKDTDVIYKYANEIKQEIQENHQQYIDKFVEYMQTGNVENLSLHFENDAYGLLFVLDKFRAYNLKNNNTFMEKLKQVKDLIKQSKLNISVKKDLIEITTNIINSKC